MENCIFCKIIHGTIPSEKVYENETVSLALSWLDSGAFVSTLRLFEDLGISFSPRVFMKKELVDATNKLHVSLKKAMLESDRVDNLPNVFAEINA